MYFGEAVQHIVALHCIGVMAIGSLVLRSAIVLLSWTNLIHHKSIVYNLLLVCSVVGNVSKATIRLLVGFSKVHYHRFPYLLLTPPVLCRHHWLGADFVSGHGTRSFRSADFD